ncbi:MAG TPA: hypothetical protein VFY01_12715 [Rheinheimera sp.]|nr:hypothetical protein [Rheinheimera sp.]
MKSVYLSSILVLSAALAGCGGSSSSDETTADSYLQFYNGAANAGNTQLKAGDTNIGTAVYGDVSSVVALKADAYELELVDVASAADLLTEDAALTKDNKTLFILTQQDEQYDHLSLSFEREPELEDKFNLHLVNLSEQYPQLDVHIAAEGKPFADAELLSSLSLHEVTAEAETRDVGKYNLYLTEAGETTPVFTAQAVDFAYENTYVMIIRDKHGPLADQLSLDVVLNSSSVTAYNNLNASAQFRLYNSLAQPVELALDNNVVATVAAGAMSNYIPGNKGDYSLSVRDASNNLLLNSALLSLAAGDSKAVLLYNNADAEAEALTVQEQDTPQLQAHDVIVANLVPDFAKLQFYFVRQNETISNARYNVKNLEFKKQQTISLPKDYYAISLVQVAENGSTTLLDKTASMMLEPGKHYTLLAEQDDAAPSGYKLKLVH